MTDNLFFDDDERVPCERCEGDGSYSTLAECTTHDPDCACNGPRVIVDPCPDCRGTGEAPGTALEASPARRP